MFTVLHQQLLATTRDKHKASAGHILKKRKAKEMVEEVQMEEELQVEEEHMEEEEV